MMESILENINNELSLEIRSIQLKYLPFIEEMMDKEKGTPAEMKWQKMHDLIVNGKQKITIEKLRLVEKMLKELKKREDNRVVEDNTSCSKNTVELSEKPLSEIKYFEISSKEKADKECLRSSSDEKIDLSPANSSMSSENPSSSISDHSYAKTIAGEFKDTESSSEIGDDEPQHSSTLKDFKNIKCEDGLVTEKASAVVETLEQEKFQKMRTGNACEVTTKVESQSFNDVKAYHSSDLEIKDNDKLNQEDCNKKSDKTSLPFERVHSQQKVPSKRLKKTSNSGQTGNQKQSATFTKSKAARKSRSSAGALKPKTSVPASQRLKRKRDDSNSVKGDVSEEEDFKGWPSPQIEDCIPSPPKAESRLWTYKSVCNLAFAKSRRGYLFKCLIHGCRFQTLVGDTLQSHLSTKHSDQDWNGFCNICMNLVDEKKTKIRILDEYAHAKYHIESLEGTENCLKVTKRRKVLSNIKSTDPQIENLISIMRTSSKIIKPPSITKPKQSLPFKPVIPNVVIATSKDLLRPWLQTNKTDVKSNDLTETMRSRQALCATYKCMDSSCSFFTIDAGLFKLHLSLHVKVSTANHSNFLKCAYCDLAESSSDTLIKHIDDVHAFDRFQCNYCFYRSCADFNVLTHQSIFHKATPNLIIVCPEKSKRDTNAELNHVKLCRGKNVPPMICVFCRGIFFVMKTFEDHLLTHKANTEARCITCGLKTNKQSLHEHLEKCHGLAFYHCVYCRFGTNTFETINNHIANDHPSKLPVFCERSELKKADGTLKHPSPSVVEGTCLKNIKQVVSKSFLCDKQPDIVLLRNEENVGKFGENSFQNNLPTVQEQPPKALVQKLPKKPQKIVAKMPNMTAKSTYSFIESLIKPLK